MYMYCYLQQLWTLVAGSDHEFESVAVAVVASTPYDVGCVWEYVEWIHPSRNEGMDTETHFRSRSKSLLMLGSRVDAEAGVADAEELWDAGVDLHLVLLNSVRCKFLKF
jgi:hypothetical protein